VVLVQGFLLKNYKNYVIITRYINTNLMSENPTETPDQAEASTEILISPEAAKKIFEDVSISYSKFYIEDMAEIDKQLELYEDAWISKLPEADQGEALRQKAFCRSIKFRRGIVEKLVQESLSSGGHGAFAASEIHIGIRIRNPKTPQEYGDFLKAVIESRRTAEMAVAKLPRNSKNYKKAQSMLEELRKYEKQIKDSEKGNQ